MLFNGINFFAHKLYLLLFGLGNSFVNYFLAFFFYARKAVYKITEGLFKFGGKLFKIVEARHK